MIAGEECDDGNRLDGDGCSGECTKETSATCGDNHVDPGEQCDDGNKTDGDGCTALCALEHTYGGGGGEAYDSCLLDWGVQGSASGALLGCDDGSAPCQRDDATGDCTFTVFYCFNASPLVGNTPACLPTGIAHVEIDAGSVLDPATENAILDAFTTTLTRWGGATVTRTGLALRRRAPGEHPAHLRRLRAPRVIRRAAHRRGVGGRHDGTAEARRRSADVRLRAVRL